MIGEPAAKLLWDARRAADRVAPITAGKTFSDYLTLLPVRHSFRGGTSAYAAARIGRLDWKRRRLRCCCWAGRAGWFAPVSAGT